MMTTEEATTYRSFSHKSTELGEVLLWQVLEQIGYGVMVVDETLKLQYCNAVAARSVASRMFDEYAVFRRAAVDSTMIRFREGISAALAGRGSILEIPDWNSTPELTLALSPGPTVHGLRCVLIILRSFQGAASESFRAYSAKLHLTARESEVVGNLYASPDLQLVAKTLGLTLDTVRVHVKAALRKAELNSLRTLLLKIASLPPLIPGLYAHTCLETCNKGRNSELHTVG